MSFTILHHLFGHFVDLRIRSIVHHRIREHEKHIPLKLVNPLDPPILDLPFDCLQVHRSLDHRIIIRSIRFPDWGLKDRAESVGSHRLEEGEQEWFGRFLAFFLDAVVGRWGSGRVWIRIFHIVIIVIGGVVIIMVIMIVVVC